MPTIRAAKHSFDHVRRRIARGLFRLASCMLRGSIVLHERHAGIPIVRAALTIVGLLEKSAAVMLFGLKACRRMNRREGQR